MLHTSRVEVRVDIRLPSMAVVDVSAYLKDLREGGVGTIRSSVNPVSREVELSLGSLIFDNSDGRFNYGLPDSMFEKNAYSGLRVRTWFRWVNENGSIVGPILVSTGFIDYILWDVSSATAEVKLYDALHKIRLPEVLPSAIGVVISASQSPAYNALALLRQAGIEDEYIDVDSFDTADTDEATALILMKHYAPARGSYLAALQEVLKHGNAGLACTRDGKIKYYRWLPDLASGDPELTEREQIMSFSGSESFSAIRNTVRVRKGDGAVSPTIDTAYTTRSTTTLPGIETRSAPDLDLLYFSSTTPRDLVADRSIELTSWPPGTYVAECHLDAETCQLELLQKVRVRVPRMGFNPKDLLIIEATLTVGSSRATFVLYDTAVESQPWLYTNNAQQLDDGQLIF